jgi:hypothetical protein
MAVVINEFEVVTAAEQSGPQQTGGQEAPMAACPPPPSPHDVERVIHRQKERYARVRGH